MWNRRGKEQPMGDEKTADEAEYERVMRKSKDLAVDTFLLIRELSMHLGIDRQEFLRRFDALVRELVEEAER